MDTRSGQAIHRFDDARFPAAFSGDGKQLLTSSPQKQSKLWDIATGALVNTYPAPEGGVDALAFTPQGLRALGGGREGHVRISRVDTGELLVSAFAAGSADWLTITPAGIFAGSPGATHMLSIVRGLTSHSVLQFFDALYSPHLLEVLLKGDPEGAYRNAAASLNVEKLLDSGPAPQIELLEKKTERAGDSVKVAIRIVDQGGGIGAKVVWKVNGTTRGELVPPPPREDGTVVITQGLRLDPSRPSSIEIIAYNKAGLLASLPFQIGIDASGMATAAPLPRLFVLAIGVSDYAMKEKQLKFPAKDASAFVQALQLAGTSLFTEIKPVMLLDHQANKQDIAAAFDQLRRRSARPTCSCSS